MKNYISKEAYYDRMKNLAAIDKTSVNETKTRNLGNLIDFERAANGVAYGIIKEKHNYYIKKGGLNENQNVADFAYIGGLGNITNFEYKSLAEATKNRNFLLQTINEGFKSKVVKTTKKIMLTEDKTSKEIDDAESKLGDLEAATAAAEVPAEPAMGLAPEVPAEPAIDLAPEVPAEPAIDLAPEGDIPPVGDEPTPEMGIDAGEKPAPEGDIPPVGDGEEIAVDDSVSEEEREIEKSLGKITNTLRKAELEPTQIKSYVNTFLSAFKDKFPDVEIEDRKEMAEKITKVVPDKEIEDLGQSVEDSEKMVAEEQGQCAECGGFAQYAESRGYNVDSIKECGEEEMTNMISGYANCRDDQMGDNDFKAIAIFITPEIIEKLKGEYGHDNLANQVEPFSQEMNETSAEDKNAQINELFGSLNHIAKKASQDIKQGDQNIAGTADLSKSKTNEEGIPVDSVEVQPTMEEDVNITVTEKSGKKLSPDNVPQVEMKENDEVEGEDLESTEVAPEVAPEGEDVLDLTKRVEPELKMQTGFEPMGGGVVKPDGAPTTTMDITVDGENKTVNVTMNESEVKIRKYIRNRLEEHAGLKKPILSETKKSDKLSKLDGMIEKQFNLFESRVLKKQNIKEKN